MSIIYKSGDTVKTNANVLVLGGFDGLHTAHQRLIDNALNYAKKNKLNCGIMIFDLLPSEVFIKDFKKLMTLKDKTDYLACMDFIYLQSFNKEFYSMKPTDFIKYLIDKLKVGCVFVGYNYRFGKNAEGDVKLLESELKKYNVSIHIENKFEADSEAVSSTKIRNLISVGEIKKANELLGYDYTVEGIVEHGLKNGTKLGFPTANIKYDKSILLPKSGVYAGYCKMGNTKYKSVINIGKNPTFNADILTLECHLLDFDKEIYGENLRVSFCEYLREEIKFSSVDKLKEQIKKDILNAERI